MLRAESTLSAFKPYRKLQASDTGTKNMGSQPGQSGSKQGAQPSAPALKRSNSLPSRLPSEPLQATEVKSVRKPVTRPTPDRKPPKDFQTGWGKHEGAALKQEELERNNSEHFLKNWLVPRIESSREYMSCLEAMHPKFRQYTSKNKEKAYKDLALSHPKLRAEIARKRNAVYSVPSYATSSRLMKPTEQKFLSQAMRHIQDDVARKPFHRHGESGIVGNKHGDIVEFRHEPGGAVSSGVREGDKYTIHNHRPFLEPFTSSASETDHLVAAETYLYFNKMKEYVTNGKDVLHIQPASLELVKLLPDPKVEAKLGKFPEAFRLPAPQQPPRPFSNHEAPAAFKKNWAPPPGWSPPEDYPRA